MDDSEIISKKINDGVEIIEYADGHTTFRSVDDKPKIEEKPKEESNRSWLGKIVDWWKDAKIKPYVKVRDLADPFGERTDADVGCDDKTGIEAGIKISF